MTHSDDCVSGLWHQKQLKGQPLRKTVVRIPGPSLTLKRWISVIRMLSGLVGTDFLLGRVRFAPAALEAEKRKLLLLFPVVRE